MKLKVLRVIDFFLLPCVMILSVIGILFIYSSAINADGILTDHLYIRQSIWMGASFVAMIIVAFIDYRRYLRFAPFMFLAIIPFLFLVLVLNRTTNGANSWLGIGSGAFKLGIQPSEFTKVLLILFLAWYFERSKKDHPRKRFIISLIIMGIPTALVLVQPDMGTAAVYVAIFLFMCFVAGIPMRYIMMLVSVGFLTIILVVLPEWQDKIYRKSVFLVRLIQNKKAFYFTVGLFSIISIMSLLGRIFLKKKYYYWITYVMGIISVSMILSIFASKVLYGYQITRLIIFLDPSIDTQNAGWHIRQSKIAIGNGYLFGMGFLNGSQSHRQFLSEQMTDFIFGIIAEETGFFGCLLLFLLYLTILLRIIHITKETTNTFGMYICGGVLGMLAFHFIINVGMVMGIMPITGIPLPFLSYGGSSLITNYIAIGIIMDINYRRLDFKMPV